MCGRYVARRADPEIANLYGATILGDRSPRRIQRRPHPTGPHLLDRVRRSSLKLPTDRLVAATLTGGQVRSLMGACDRLRDRFLLMLLACTGMRIGEAFGLRHEDIEPSGPTLLVRQRVNANQARAKTWSRDVPVDEALIHAYSDYLHEEYGDLDSDVARVAQTLDHARRC